MLNGFWGKIWAGGGSFWMNKDCLKEYPSLIYSLLIKNDKKCNDIYMTWGHMVGGPQNTVTPIPPSPKTKTSIPNKPTVVTVSETWPVEKIEAVRSRRKPSNSSSKPFHPHASRVTQINFEEFLEGSLRLNGAAKYLGSSSLVVVAVIFFFLGGTRFWP